MNSKLTVVGAISAAVGAVVSWAVTADHYDLKRKEAEDAANEYERLLRASEDEVYELQQKQAVIFNQYLTTGSGVSSEEMYQEVAKKLQDVKNAGPELDEKLKTSAEKIAEMQAEHVDETVEGETDATDPNVVDLAVYHESPETGVVEAVTVEEELREAGIIPEGETLEETTSNLQAIIDQYTNNPNDRDEFVAAALEPPSQRDAAPFVIPKETFAWDDEGDEYDKKTLTYFPQQRLLLDEEEEIIDDVPQIVGWRNLSRFGDESGDADTVFVRNRKLRTDFEVVRELEAKPPLHVAYGMDRETFRANRAAGLIRLRPEDT